MEGSNRSPVEATRSVEELSSDCGFCSRRYGMPIYALYVTRCTTFFLFQHMDSERMTRCLSYFSMPSDFMQSEAPEVEAEVAALDPPPRESLDEQPSVANV